ECIKSGLQIDHQVRPGHRFVKKLVQTVENHQFRVVQGQISKDFALREGVVGDHQLGKEVPLRDLPLLVVAGQHEEELRAKCGTAFVFVKVVEERIVDVLQNLRSAEQLRQKGRQRRLADADRTLHRDVLPGKRDHDSEG